ncbi:MAG TPA: CaiB/BaiF CoA-transferase family protein [Streptosporangiaceae bacterium]|nr:CaiB/BaiF CoA-transferase family protein [Streptosporangiaceae bacterium]
MGPLHGVRVVEIASLAPAPFGCMVLADMGADVVRVDRPGPSGSEALVAAGPLGRGRRSIVADLKDPAGVDILLRLADHADVLVEAFRPGVAERLGFGPEVCAQRNPRLVYARMSGWGQEGPLASTAGHDIDYIAVAGTLEPIGRAGQPPVPPLNLVGDFGGGGMFLVAGVLAALLERERSGLGQVVDAAMVDGSALLAAFLYGLRATGTWQDERGTNLLDGGAPFYDTYETADGRYMAVGALEPKFYAELVAGLGLDAASLPAQSDRAQWPVLRERMAARFAERTQAEWVAVFADTDACVAPVLSPAQAPQHPHNAARGTFIDVGGVLQPAPAPRFSRTACAQPSPPPPPGADTDQVLAGLGLTPDQVKDLRHRGIVT